VQQPVTALDGIIPSNAADLEAVIITSWKFCAMADTVASFFRENRTSNLCLRCIKG
jgi:hypothetical protein